MQNKKIFICYLGEKIIFIENIKKMKIKKTEAFVEMYFYNIE